MRAKSLLLIVVGLLVAGVILTPAVSLAAKAEKEGAKEASSKEASGEGAAGGSGNSMATDPLAVDPDLAIWTAVVFLALFAVLYKFAWGPIAKGLDAREKGIADNIEAAQRSFDEAKLILAGYEKKLAGAQQEIRDLMDKAHKDAEYARQEILNEAKASAKEERDRTLVEINRARDVALKELSEQSANVAVELAGKIVRNKLTSEEQTSLVNDAMNKFAASMPSKN